MAFPALIYIAFNYDQPETIRGWAIPTATDIAFALGVLSLLGNRVPASLKVFLTALAIIDDLGAVIIIALFYTSGLSLAYLGAALAILVLLIAMNRFGVTRLWLYLAIGAVLWFVVLKSGVHATLAGVALALTIPLRRAPGIAHDLEVSPLHRLEHLLHGFVPFIVIPIFGFANAGVSFAGMSLGDLAEPLTLGVALGLILGKLVGVFGTAYLAIRTGIAAMPANSGWSHLLGVALLCGIGFTMSLFIGLLAFADSEILQEKVKIGILSGSFAAAILGSLVLYLGPKPAPDLD
jgi:NhaA family Na+:H+ antiporter